MNLDMTLLIAALIFFILGTFGAVAKINPVAAGLFCWVLTMLI